MSGNLRGTTICAVRRNGQIAICKTKECAVVGLSVAYTGLLALSTAIAQHQRL